MDSSVTHEKDLFEAMVLKEFNRLRSTLDEILELKGKEGLNLAINGKSYHGKSLTDLSSALGLEEALKILIKRGANINTASGYAPIHYAACWGKTACLEVLYENSANIVCKTENNESARDLAMKYNQNESADFLDWAESEYLLMKERAAAAVVKSDKKKV